MIAEKIRILVEQRGHSRIDVDFDPITGNVSLVEDAQGLRITKWDTALGPQPTQAELDAITDRDAKATLDQIAETNEKENAKLDIDKRFIRALITVMEQRHREQGNLSPAQWRNRIRAAIDNG